MATNILDRLLDRLMRWLKVSANHRGLAFVKREVFIVFQVARSIQNDEISRRAAALTYHTLLSLVPLLAVAFALFKAFGGFQALQEPLEGFIFDQLAIPNADRVADWLEGFVTQVNSGAIAGVGLLVLFYSAGGLLTNIEQALNRVWNVRLRRPLYVRMAIYWCILTLGPPIVALSITFSTTIINDIVSAWMGHTIAGLLLSLVGPASISLMFFAVYVMVPDTHVPWKNAAVSAVVTSVVWNVAKAGFLWTTRASSNYSAIYGAMSALPLLMIWIYLSWNIVLFGAAYGRARGEVTRLSLDPEPEPGPPTLKVIARVVVAIWEHFRHGRVLTTESIATAAGVPMPLCRGALEILTDRGLIEDTGQEQKEGTEYVLKKHLGDLSLAALDDLLFDPKVRRCEARLADSPLWSPVEARLTRAEHARRSLLDISVAQATAAPPDPGAC
ncbi:MAG: YihY family inner membrane protein [Myxococcales bacterium]|nr:YihY family inner membrane protein [Myxococcales bacterium]